MADKCRYFEGKRYRWVHWFSQKGSATLAAKQLRARGNLARVIPENSRSWITVPGYAVYTRKEANHG